VRYERFIDRHPEARGLAPIANIGLIAVGSVLLIACFNVAGLMLARSFERRRDIGVRAALGAGRWRLARALLTEGLLLAVIAGAAALLLAYWSASILSAFSLPAPIPQRLHFVTDWRLVGFAVLVSALAALIPSLAPIWQIARADLTQWSRAGQTAGAAGLGQRRTRRVFVLLQVAGSTLFLTTALMTATAFRGAWQLDPGFDVDRTAVLTVSPTSFGATPAAALATMRAVAARVAGAPGVEAVTVTDRAPYQLGVARQMQVSADGRDCASGGCTAMSITRIDRGYFSTSTRRVVAGTPSDADDSAQASSIVINQAAADRLWPGETPIGKSFRVDGVWREVRGVVTNAQPAQNVTESPTAFLPFERGGAGGSLAVIVRGHGDARALIAPMRDALRGIDPALPIQSIQTMDERMALPLWMPRTILGFFTICATLAVLLSTVGLFGVTYFAVNQRRREFGVRSALGASIADVRRLVLGETIRLAAPGVALGLAAAFGTMLIARATLPSVPALGLAPYGLAMVIQVLVALAAGWSPARRAAKAQPVEVLRE
jgi:predicted permease